LASPFDTVFAPVTLSGDALTKKSSAAKALDVK